MLGHEIRALKELSRPEPDLAAEQQRVKVLRDQVNENSRLVSELKVRILYVCVLLCAYICVCVYVRPYVCVYVHVYVHVYVYVHLYVHVHVHVHVSFSMCTNTYVYI
jgi:hypothetical protein